MCREKPGSGILGLLLLAALSLTALTASSAQALTWDLEGKEITVNTPFDGRLKEELLLLVPNLNLIIHCAELQTEDGLLLPNNTAHISLILSQCVTLANNKKIACTTTLLLTKLKILPFLHNGKVYLLYEPLVAGQPFWVIHHLGELCPLPELVNVTGSVVYECENGLLVPIDCQVPKTNHLIKPANPALFPLDELRYGAHPAFLHGEAELLLSDEKDLGMTFNALV
jgi:hypothetical protein